MNLRTEKQKKLIVNNVVKCINNNNMDILTKQSYDYLYLCSGFIAHYNRYGFIEYYKRENLLKDILMNFRYNQWDNFRPNEKDYSYYMEKKEIYNSIINAVNPHLVTDQKLKITLKCYVDILSSNLPTSNFMVL